MRISLFPANPDRAETCGPRPRWRKGSARTAGLVAVALATLVLVGRAIAARSNALWFVVHDLCVPAARASGHPFPCVALDRVAGYALIRNYTSATELLLVPTARISGVESPAALDPASRVYWQAAWQARHRIERRFGHTLSRDQIGLAINSKYGRHQDQLHIHIDCVRPDILRSLRAEGNSIGDRWADLELGEAQRPYRATRMAGADLDGRNPLAVLASRDPRARADMSREGLAVIGATFADGSPGFFLLSNRADPARRRGGAMEQVLDHRCGTAAR